MAKNRLYFGDNLEVLRRYVGDESVDLIYLDPPFNSNANYNVLFQEHDGTRAESQIRAFEDTWRWDEGAARAYRQTVAAGGRLSQTMQAFRFLVGESDMLAYLSMMAPRLRELHRVLKPTGSIYLHCDTTASHYLKLLMDAVFDVRFFRNEIVWKRTNVHSDSKTWSRVSDSILFYTRSDLFTWTPKYEDHSEAYIAQKYRQDDGDGRGKYRLDNMTSPNPRPKMIYAWKGFSPPPKGWRFQEDTMRKLDAEGRIWYPRNTDGTFDINRRPQLKRYLSEMPGVIAGNVWTDINPINSQARERLGYPTQKPIALLDRIVRASSNEGDMVLDPFCGCGTTIDAAEKLGRRWIGIDITHLAINLIRHRLRDTYGERITATYEVVGEPASHYDARVLAEQDPYQFQWWALGLVEARPVEQKKGADKEIDGRLFFHDDPASGKTKQVVFSVKAGKLQVAHVRDLHGVLERENAALGVLISLHSPTKAMRAEAADAGVYKSPWGTHPRLQLLTVAEILEGKRIDMPSTEGINVTFKRAKRRQTSAPLQMVLQESDEEDSCDESA